MKRFPIAMQLYNQLVILFDAHSKYKQVLSAVYAYLALDIHIMNVSQFFFLGFAKINPVNNNIVPTLMRKTGSNDEPTN